MTTPRTAVTRGRILDATEAVIRDRGMARATTKEIARAAGLSEAALYKHFASKEDLVLQVLSHRMPEFIEPLKQLPARAGEATVTENLEPLTRQALDYYEQIMDLVSSLFAEPQLLAQHQQRLAERGAGPHLAIRTLAAYLAREQQLGRVAPSANPETAASLLLGACYQRAFLTRFVGEDRLPGTREQFPRDLVTTLLSGIIPR